MSARRSMTSYRTTPGPLRAARRMALLLLSGPCFAIILPAVTLAQNAPIVRPSASDPFAAYIAEAAARFKLPAAWLRAVLRAESAGDPRATSPKGAMGLMQIMPSTWAGLRVRHRLGDNPYDPHDNIIAGTAYIRELVDRYGTPGWIAAYNAGPGRYEASLNGQSLPQETRAYVAAVAPAIGAGDSASPIIVAAADPLAWMRASLFIAQPDRRPPADPVPAERSRNGAPNAALVRDVSAIEPQSGGLFVVRTPERNTP